MQEVGTRIFYGEPVNGIGVGFNDMMKYQDFMEYVNYQCTCLASENVDIKDEEFQGVAFTMSARSARNFFADMGANDLIESKRKVHTVKSEYGVKLLITIKD